MTHMDVVKLKWKQHYRIVPSVFPPINFFEKLVPSDQMEALWYLESLTNERLLIETGNILLVDPKDAVFGPGASVLMAPFTHIGNPSRFSPGDYGVYYAAQSRETAIHETIYHRERFMHYTQEEPGEISMRIYIGKVKKPLHDIRSKTYKHLHHPDNYQPSQNFAQQLKKEKAWGIVYPSVRHPGGECIAALRPPAVSVPIQGEHLSYVWNGEKISHVYLKGDMVLVRD